MVNNDKTTQLVLAVGAFFALVHLGLFDGIVSSIVGRKVTLSPEIQRQQRLAQQQSPPKTTANYVRGNKLYI